VSFSSLIDDTQIESEMSYECFYIQKRAAYSSYAFYCRGGFPIKNVKKGILDFLYGMPQRPLDQSQPVIISIFSRPEIENAVGLLYWVNIV
jgi:hypothetical protein